MSFIKLDRKLLTWEWKDDPKMVALWVEILLQANYAETHWHGITFKPGQFPTSIEKLANATGLTKSQVRTCLNKLQITHEIALKSHKSFTQITVIKWGEYQGFDDGDCTQNRTQSAHEIALKSQHLKKYKNTRSKEDILPVYDPSLNDSMTDEQAEELLELMKGTA